MTFFKALLKLFKRKKKDGYYESGQMLTIEERQSLIIGLMVILIPIIIGVIMILIN